MRSQWLRLSHDTLEVLRDAPCSVAVAPAGYAARTADIHRTGVAYDGSKGREQPLILADRKRRR